MERAGEDRHGYMTQEEMFNEFWRLYPKKVAKLSAQKAFRSRRFDKDTFAVLMGSIVALAERADKGEFRGAEKHLQFCPHPDTFLRQGRDLDEPEPETAKPISTCKWCGLGIYSNQPTGKIDSYVVHAKICLSKAREYYKINGRL